MKDKNKNIKKVAIITGAGQGIGKGIAEHFYSKGFAVVIAEMNKKPKELVEKKDYLFIRTDVSEESSVEKMIAKVNDQFGRLDVLVNNAGILNVETGSIEKLSLKVWEEIISTNLTGPFLCAKHACPLLRKSRGSIINIASTRALQSESHNEPYSSSKGGLISLTQALAISLGPEIRVNCVSPGWIETKNYEKLKSQDHKQHPVGRVGKIEDIAPLVYFLSSEEAGFITGQNFVADGGMTKKMIYFD